MPSRIQIRRDTAANWTSVNPVLAQGEIGFEYDTRKSKIGDGTSAWTSLGYVIDESFSTADKAKLFGVQAGAQVNIVVSVHGRTGAIAAQPGDYTADQIIDTAAKVLMTTAERSKLADVQAGAQVNTVASVHGRIGVISAQPGRLRRRPDHRYADQGGDDGRRKEQARYCPGRARRSIRSPPCMAAPAQSWPRPATIPPTRSPIRRPGC